MMKWSYLKITTIVAVAVVFSGLLGAYSGKQCKPKEETTKIENHSLDNMEYIIETQDGMFIVGN